MKKNQSLKVKEKCQLMDFLLTNLQGKSRNNIKSLLGYGQINVNGKVVKQYNYELSSGDEIEINMNKSRNTINLNGIEIIHEDGDILVIDKPAGLLSMASNKEKEKTAYSILTDYVKGKNSRNRIFIVHRLDRDTSGVMVFAKNENSKKNLQDNWNEKVKERIYIALVEGKVNNEKGTIKSWLKENKAFVTYSTYSEKDGGKLAITNYKTLKKSNLGSLLEVELETGRKNQIRVHMSDLGHPVSGDKKYGARGNFIKRLGLHAKTIKFTHPTTNKEVSFESQIPNVFFKIFDKKGR
ncbi:RluA family pseudouridine synthase [Cetobacterium ceti]